MQDKRFMLIYSDDGNEVIYWFDTENELIDFVTKAKRGKYFEIEEAIEIIQSREIKF